jgi:hypothetical protein
MFMVCMPQYLAPVLILTLVALPFMFVLMQKLHRIDYSEKALLCMTVVIAFLIYFVIGWCIDDYLDKKKKV